MRPHLQAVQTGPESPADRIGRLQAKLRAEIAAEYGAVLAEAEALAQRAKDAAAIREAPAGQREELRKMAEFLSASARRLDVLVGRS